MSRRPRSKERGREESLKGSLEIDPPYRDPVFMESLPSRPVRILTAYIDPLERLRREKVGDTIVMFGSAHHFLGHVARRQSPEVCNLLGGRAGNHGGCQSGRLRGGRKIHRPEHSI